MAKTVQIALLADDAEPILRRAAEDAAKYGAWLDYITRKTWDAPGRGAESREKVRREWSNSFRHAKRVVEAFGIEYEPTSESETIAIHYPHMVGGRFENVAGFRMRTGGETDYKRPEAIYRRSVHAEACRQAAKRVVRRWRAGVGHG